MSKVLKKIWKQLVDENRLAQVCNDAIDFTGLPSVEHEGPVILYEASYVDNCMFPVFDHAANILSALARTTQIYIAALHRTAWF
jgi:hypothetical protein